jgi:hypothetical protein
LFLGRNFWVATNEPKPIIIIIIQNMSNYKKELNEVKNKQQEQDGRLESQERLDNHEGKLNSIWEENALLKENILENIKHTLIKALPNISSRKRSVSIYTSTTGHNDNISQK